MTATINASSTEIASAAGFNFSEPERPPEPAFGDWFRENIMQSRWLTLFAAFYVHWIAILTLAAIFLQAPIEFRSVTLNAVISDSALLDTSSVEFLETEAELSVAEDVTEQT